VAIALAFALLTLLAAPALASADLSFGTQGSGAGQTAKPQGVAIDTSSAEAASGHVYVSDWENHRVDVFDSSAAFLFAFGWGVNAENPEAKLQVCTVVTGCQKGTPGSGAGQLSSPSGVAVDPSSHAVYVTDAGNSRIEKFDSEGHFLLMFGKGVNTGTSGKPNLCTNAGPPTDVCGAGSEGGGPGEFNGIRGLAIGAGGSVYVADNEHVGPCASGGPADEEFTKRVQKFSAAGEALEAIDITDSPCGRTQGFAVDPSGDFYLSADAGSAAGGAVRKYDPAGNPVIGWGEGGKANVGREKGRLALDPAGDLFVANGPIGVTPPHIEISEYDTTGTQIRAFYSSLQSQLTGLNVYHTANGDVFATAEGGVMQTPLPPPGPLTVPGSTQASEIGNSKATLKAQVNPEGKATEFALQYVDDVTFQADIEAEGPGHGFDHTQATPFEAIPGPGGSSFLPQSVSKKLPVATLAPETKYHLRLLAKNADAPAGNAGPEVTFTTLGPPEVLETWATEVGSDLARLHAEVNPLLLATTGYFQYVDDATYRADVEALGAEHGFDHAASVPDVGGGDPPLDFGSGEAPVARAATAYPLVPGTTYHYRLVAEDPFAPVFGPERLLQTFAPPGGADTECPNQAFRSGPSAALPDCRAYEMVSPLDKDNGDVLALLNIFNHTTLLDQSSVDGSAFTFSSYRAFADPKSAPYTNQFLAKRKAGSGWQTESLDPQGPGASFFENPVNAFSPDLGSAWLTWRNPAGEPRPDPCAPAETLNLYRRDNASGVFSALSCAEIDTGFFQPEIQGFSVDGSHSVFRADAALTPDASGATGAVPVPHPIYQLYESNGAGQLQLVSVLPNGEAAERDASAGAVGETNPNSHWNFNRLGSLSNAVSADGRRVFWSTPTNGGIAGPIYLRLNADQAQSEVAGGECTEPTMACTIPVSASVTPSPARFQIGNPQGTKALFVIGDAGGALAGNLYEFDAEAEPPASHLVAEDVIESILGASEDLSRVYFASKEASPTQQAEGAEAGKPNVYLSEEGTIRFVATLSSGSELSDTGNSYGTPMSSTPIFHVARVSPSSGALVFMSDSRALSERVAGYNNTDAVSGEADAEVYLYDADADGGAGKLRCISCNPSGARPRGGELNEEVNQSVIPWGAASVPRFQTQLHQPRYLSDDGRRAFFNSFEALVPGDTNGKQDVYEWEAAGEGNCTSQSRSYVPGSEGCLSLISSGQSSSDSKFLDATPSGSDVFFTTAEGLLPQDYGLIDVYDARAGGGFPPPTPPLPACEGDTCQSPPPAPNDPTAASASFKGVGNVAPRKQHKRKRAHKTHKKRSAKHRSHRHAARRTAR
jgi:DNA-binding beta-propeller fold protein YncE